MAREPVGLLPWASNPAVTHDARQSGNRSTSTDLSYVIDIVDPPDATTCNKRPRVARARSGDHTHYLVAVGVGQRQGDCRSQGRQAPDVIEQWARCGRTDAGPGMSQGGLIACSQA